jgi:predicted ATP-binding protein involved in virulence
MCARPANATGENAVRLDRLRLLNYRCFEDFEIDFDPHLTILIASNGGGKTSILDAARVALWPYVKGFDLGSQVGKSATVQMEDVRRVKFSNDNMEPQVPCAISAWGEWRHDSKQMNWSQQRSSVRRNTATNGDTNCRLLTEFAKKSQAEVRKGTEVTLPLITYPGTSRLWYEGRFSSTAEKTTLDKNEFSRTSGYLNCLSYSSSFKAFSAWYTWIYRSYREAQSVSLEMNASLSGEGKRFAQIIKAIKTAVDHLITAPTGWHTLQYSAAQQQLVMPVEMLSDGLRNAIAMVADLAFRMCKLNPHLGARAPLETPGVALIDEVDMFLHPYWQQTVVAALRAAFPALQLIVTTHSPQVLSTVRRENIRVISHNAQGDSVYPFCNDLWRAKQPCTTQCHAG